MRKLIFLFVILFAIGIFYSSASRMSFAQDSDTQKTKLFERFPNNSNKGNLVVDEDFIWVANGAGLIRYNKKSGGQKVFTESDGLLSNNTTGLIQYKDELWVACPGSGISILDTKNNSWRYLSVANGLVDDRNLIIRLDGDVIWLATANGFAKYDFKSGKWTNWKEGAGVKFAGVRDFVFNDNFVWIYVSPNYYTSGGVLRLDKKTLTWTDLQNNNQFFFDRQSDYLYLDGDLFYAVAREKIYRQNIISGQWGSFENNGINLNNFNIGAAKHDNQYWTFNKDGNIEISEALNNNRQIIKTGPLNQYCPAINHFFPFSGEEAGYKKRFCFDGNILWFGGRQGFARYDLSNKTWDFKETRSRYPAEIYNILSAKDGMLLVDSNLGLGLVMPDEQKWTFIVSFEASNSMWGGAVWNGNDIYFVEILGAFGYGGAHESRLWEYNIPSKTISQIKTPNGLVLGKIIELKTNNILWFNAENKILEFDLSSGQITSYEAKISQENDFAITDIKTNNDVLWFASSLGLGRFDLISRKYEIIENPLGNKFPDGNFDHLFTVGNKIWADASFSPVYVYDLTTKTWEYLIKKNSGLKFDLVANLFGTTDYLLLSSVGRFDLSQVKTGVSSIYMGSKHVYQQYGLNIYDMKNIVWKYFTSEDGMLDGYIENIIIDGNNAWFVNGKSGIWKLDLDRLK